MSCYLSREECFVSGEFICTVGLNQADVVGRIVRPVYVKSINLAMSLCLQLQCTRFFNMTMA